MSHVRNRHAILTKVTSILIWFPGRGGQSFLFAMNNWSYATALHQSALYYYTLFESENERQKIEPDPIPLPRDSRNFPDVKTRKIFFFHNWTLEIIPFIGFWMQMVMNKKFFWDVKSCFFIVIQLCYSKLWPFSH